MVCGTYTHSSLLDMVHMGGGCHIESSVSDIDHTRVLISVSVFLLHQVQERWTDYHHLESRSLCDYLGNRVSILVGRYERD